MSTIEVDLPAEGFPNSSKTLKAIITRNATGKPTEASFKSITSSGSATVQLEYNATGKIRSSPLRFGTIGTIGTTENVKVETQEDIAKREAIIKHTNIFGNKYLDLVKRKVPIGKILLSIPLEHRETFKIAVGYIEELYDPTPLTLVTVKLLESDLLKTIGRTNIFNSETKEELAGELKPYHTSSNRVNLPQINKPRDTRLNIIDDLLKKRVEFFKDFIRPFYEKLLNGTIKTTIEPRIDAFKKAIDKFKSSDDKIDIEDMYQKFAEKYSITLSWEEAKLAITYVFTLLQHYGNMSVKANKQIFNTYFNQFINESKPGRADPDTKIVKKLKKETEKIDTDICWYIVIYLGLEYLLYKQYVTDENAIKASNQIATDKFKIFAESNIINGARKALNSTPQTKSTVEELEKLFYSAEEEKYSKIKEKSIIDMLDKFNYEEIQKLLSIKIEEYAKLYKQLDSDIKIAYMNINNTTTSKQTTESSKFKVYSDANIASNGDDTLPLSIKDPVIFIKNYEQKYDSPDSTASSTVQQKDKINYDIIKPIVKKFNLISSITLIQTNLSTIYSNYEKYKKEVNGLIEYIITLKNIQKNYNEPDALSESKKKEFDLLSISDYESITKENIQDILNLSLMYLFIQYFISVVYKIKYYSLLIEYCKLDGIMNSTVYNGITAEFSENFIFQSYRYEVSILSYLKNINNVNKERINFIRTKYMKDETINLDFIEKINESELYKKPILFASEWKEHGGFVVPVVAKSSNSIAAAKLALAEGLKFDQKAVSPIFKLDKDKPPPLINVYASDVGIYYDFYLYLQSVLKNAADLATSSTATNAEELNNILKNPLVLEPKKLIIELMNLHGVHPLIVNVFEKTPRDGIITAEEATAEKEKLEKERLEKKAAEARSAAAPGPGPGSPLGRPAGAPRPSGGPPRPGGAPGGGPPRPGGGAAGPPPSTGRSARPARPAASNPRTMQGGGGYSAPSSLGYRTEPLFKLPPWKPRPLHLKINKNTRRKSRSSKKRTIRSKPSRK